MKNFITSGLGILVLILLVYIFFLRECGSKTTTCPPKGQMLISKQAYDSMQVLANKPPKIDTVKIKGKTVYVHQLLPITKPEPGDTTINNYTDSLVKNDINVCIDLKIKGTLVKRDWYYTPITTTITIEKYVPKLIDNPVPISRNALFVFVSVGGNKNAFLPGGGFDFITKKNTEIGFDYKRYGKEDFYSVKLGTILRFRK